jgi:hypothetical protein
MNADISNYVSEYSSGDLPQRSHTISLGFTALGSTWCSTGVKCSFTMKHLSKSQYPVSEPNQSKKKIGDISHYTAESLTGLEL